MRMGREPPEEVGIHVIEMDSHCCVEGKGQDSPGDKVKIKLLGERRTIFCLHKRASETDLSELAMCLVS